MHHRDLDGSEMIKFALGVIVGVVATHAYSEHKRISNYVEVTYGERIKDIVGTAVEGLHDVLKDAVGDEKA